MLDSNFAVDEYKLEYIAQMPLGKALLINLTQKEYNVHISDIENRFDIKKMLSETSKDNRFIVSFLYYFGVLTLAGETEYLEIKLKVPNMVMQSLYIERVQQMLLP